MPLRKLPIVLHKHKICIICEGDEEFDYLSCLKSLNVWNDNYEVVLDNAKGNGNIPARYQDRYQSGSFEIVFIFCDTERKPYEQFEDITRKINSFHGTYNVAKHVIFYGNPCTMQIILSHWADVTLNTPTKKRNAHLIFQYTGVHDYKGKASQRKIILNKITKENYLFMLNRVRSMKNDDSSIGSSNFDLLLEYLFTDNDRWINTINSYLE